MKKQLLLFLAILFCALSSSQETKKIFGTVSDDQGPLESVMVSIEGTHNKAFSDAKGKYEINAKEGDIIQYELQGKLPMETKVEDVTRILNITLQDKFEKLDAVTVTKKRRISQEQMAMDYAQNPNIIKNSFGFLDRERVGYSLRIMDEEKIGPQYIDLKTLLNGRFAGVRAGCNALGDLVVSLRNGSTTFNGSNSVVFDIDGVVLDILGCYTIDPANIKRIGIISSLVGTSIYGARGRGGVIVINTKTGTFASVQKSNYLRKKEERDKRGTYIGDAIPVDVAQPLPQYMELYNEAKTEQEAIVVYENQAVKYANSFYFALDSYIHFMNELKNRKFALSILKDQWHLFENNPIALKSLAYIHQANGDFALAKEVYKEVFLLRPEYVQSYFNMAESYTENGQYNQSASMYTRYDYLKEQAFLKDEKGEFSTLMDEEFHSLLTLKASDFLSIKQRKKLVDSESPTGTRLVFEWADSEAEFELQFVNPENRFFTWDHTLAGNKETIEDEKFLGYGTKEYILGNNYPGEWQVNIKYFGNKSLTPTYFKVAIYKNYGEEDQIKEIKVFKLTTRNLNQHLFDVTNVVKVISN